jgi:hypothetical protein
VPRSPFLVGRMYIWTVLLEADSNDVDLGSALRCWHAKPSTARLFSECIPLALGLAELKHVQNALFRGRKRRHCIFVSPARKTFRKRSLCDSCLWESILQILPKFLFFVFVPILITIAKLGNCLFSKKYRMDLLVIDSWGLVAHNRFFC